MLNNIYNLLFDKFLVFKGRSSRKEYVVKLLLTTIIFLIGGYTVDSVSSIGIFDSVYLCSLLFSMIIMLFQYFPLAVRRFHDINSSGWYVLLTFAPFGQLVILWLMFKKGTSGINDYGEEPKY